VSAAAVTTATAADVRAAVDGLSPRIAARAAEIEAARELPTDLLGDLRAAGAFRLLLPESHGGLEAALPDAVEVFEVLAAADASTAWTTMLGAGTWIDITGLPRASFDAIYADGPDVILASVINPSGSAERVEGGYRVRGRWSFASGCRHADRIVLDCAEGVVDGVPQLRMAVLDPDEVEIEDTWYVSGLAGTGSHHVRVDGAVVDAGRTFPTLSAEPCIDAPIAHIPLPAMLASLVATVAVGVARGGLDDVVALAATKLPLLAAAPLAADPTFQLDLATADVELRAARSLLHDAVAGLWSAALDGREPSLEERARVRATAAWVTTRAVAVVDTAYRVGGGSAVYDDSPLQRRLRDVHAIAQHFLVRRNTLTTAGAVLAGQPIDVPLF
jgi:indole-3-acetate monooxygenase